MTHFKHLLTVGIAAAALWCGAADSPWGIAAHPHSEMEWKNIDRQLDMMRKAGITSLRHDVKFSNIARKKGVYDFRRYDELLEKLDAAGIEFLPILEGYDWEIERFRSDAKPLYKHPEEWRKFVRACAEHYKGKLKIWEVWNEQDGGFWKPNPNAAEYVPLLKIAYEELKKADPENQQIVGGLCGWNTGYLRDMYAAGAKGYFDAIAVHPYGWGPDRSAFQAKRMAEFKRILADNGDSAKPVWITECGGATHRSNLLVQQPDVIVKAIEYAAGRIGISPTVNGKLRIGAPVSQEFPDRDFDTARAWLPGAEIVPVTPERLARLNPAELPVVIGSEHVTIEGAYKQPMLDYVKKGGILLAFGDVPLYNVREKNKQGNWTTRGAAAELHPAFRIGYQAWWTKPGLPKQTTRVRTLPAGKEAGIAELKNVYVTRFLTAENLKKGDSCTSLVEALDGNGNPAGDGMALYTFKDRKGAVLGCTLQFAGGFTEAEQARLLQTLYLSYLAAGVDRLYFYDFHNDGLSSAERENNFGIVRWNYQPKPAYHAYKAMTEALGRAPKFLERLPDLPDGVQALLFERAEGGKVLAVWTVRPDASSPIHYRGREITPQAEVQFLAL